MNRNANLRVTWGQLTYPQFPFESEAKGDNLIGVHQGKVVKLSIDLYNFNPCIVLGINQLWEYFRTEEEGKSLDNTYCLKFMQFGIGLLISTSREAWIQLVSLREQRKCSGKI